MTKDTIVYLRGIFYSITKDDQVFKANTSEPLSLRLVNDSTLNGRDTFFLWDDDKEVLWYYTDNERAYGQTQMIGNGVIAYPAALAAISYEEISEFIIPLRIDSFGQSLAYLKSKTTAKGIGDFGKEIPIDDKVAYRMKAKFFDSLDPVRQMPTCDYSKPKDKGSRY